MRSWTWGGGLAALTAVGVSWAVAPTRPAEVVVTTPPAAVAPVVCTTPAPDRLAVTDVLDIVAELRGTPPSSAEPPLAQVRGEAAGTIIPAAFLLPADPDEEAAAPREANELAPMPRVAGLGTKQLFTFTMGWGFGQ